MAERELPKLAARVRFPSPAPGLDRELIQFVPALFLIQTVDFKGFSGFLLSGHERKVVVIFSVLHKFFRKIRLYNGRSCQHRVIRVNTVSVV